MALRKTECNGVVYTHSASVKFRCAPPTPNPWVVIHERLAKIIESDQEWDGEAQKRWHDTEWLESVSGCGSCLDHYKEIKDSIDWTTAQAASDSLFKVHNRVSEEQAGKPAISYQLFRALYFQQPSLDGICMAVTSVSPDQELLARQSLCLSTWKRFGLSIVAVQPVNECDQIKVAYPMLDCVVPDYSGARIPRIASIVKGGLLYSEKVLLVNADIEIRGMQSALVDALQATAIGVRRNYIKEWWKNSCESLGVDAFVFDSKTGAELPNEDFVIGRPWWDYWLLNYFKDKPQQWITDLFFHKQHEQKWSDEDWNSYGEAFAKLYGKKLDRSGVAEFRSQFPSCS